MNSMVILIEGTFDYVFEIQTAAVTNVQGKLSRPITDGFPRLVGYAPVLNAVEYQREPWQQYARITLTASDARNATVRATSFSVEAGLIRVLRPGDLLYLARTSCGGTGLSIVRNGNLVAAAGAITSVPLGEDVSARFPAELVQQAQAVFRTRDQAYIPREHPIELTIAGETRILYSGRPQIGPYEVFIRHGFLPGLPGTDASGSIERRGVCPDTSAHTSAQLLEEERFQIDEQ